MIEQGYVMRAGQTYSIKATSTVANRLFVTKLPIIDPVHAISVDGEQGYALEVPIAGTLTATLTNMSWEYMAVSLETVDAGYVSDPEATPRSVSLTLAAPALVRSFVMRAKGQTATLTFTFAPA